MQRTGEVGEFLAAVLALTIGRVAIEHGGSGGSGVRTLVAQIDPKSTGLGLAGTGREHRDRRVIAVDHATSHDVRCDQFDERGEQPGDVAEPFGELAAIDVETATGADLGQPVQWNMIAEFADHDVAEETRVDHAARDRQLRHRRLHHRFALPA